MCLLVIIDKIIARENYSTSTLTAAIAHGLPYHVRDYLILFKARTYLSTLPVDVSPL